MAPLHPADRLRLAADRAERLSETWPGKLRLRPAAAVRLRRLAAWLDPPSPPPRRGTESRPAGAAQLR